MTEINEKISCHYCGNEEKDWNLILSYKCDGCENFVHYDCIKSNQPSPLVGDNFFTFRCLSCGADKQEEFHRIKLSWRNAVMLALYNLHKTGQGKCGFFHWKAHICSFIKLHWLLLFGHEKKRTNLWLGTVAGTLSAGCPDIFESGVNTVDQGYWRLVAIEPPMLTPSLPEKIKRYKKPEPSVVDITANTSRRRAKSNALNAAIELKEKKESLLEKRKIKKGKGKEQTRTGDIKEVSQIQGNESLPITDTLIQEGEFSVQETEASFSITDNQLSNVSNEQCVTHDNLSSITYESLGLTLGEGDDSGDDLEIDIDVESHDHMINLQAESLEIETLLQPEDIKWEQSSIPEMDTLACDNESDGQSERDIKEEMVESEIEDDNETEDETDSANDCDEGQKSDDSSEAADGEKLLDENGESLKIKKKKQGRPRKRRRLDDPQPQLTPERLQRISVFEEHELLNKLNVLAANQTLTPEMAVLRRKLICNQTNREYGQPVFDLDAQVEKLATVDGVVKDTNHRLPHFLSKLPSRPAHTKETRDLDRFMMKDGGKRKTREYACFRHRLVGLDDSELKPTISPYTTRVLVPFIWRNNSMSRLPLKMSLLQEIQAYPHRNDPAWTPPPCPSIDYCYVRPEHIASVNALAREFFWPGIDMSECLQYPDFSCVVLYRKIVIAFAFMVPDRGYNEAYISFIFTHPEWRGVGIASFMLYHLIQTCMGKDVLLHVSASNPAMLLYQKFGFKAEELSLNFYHKYFPSSSTDSCHAFLMRLTR